MKITVEQKQQTEINIELPAYYKYGESYYKILSADTAIQVREYQFGFSIGYENAVNLTLANAIENGSPITEEEFVTAFERVGEKVKRELVKAMESDAWKQQEQNESLDKAVAIIE